MQLSEQLIDYVKYLRYLAQSNRAWAAKLPDSPTAAADRHEYMVIAHTQEVVADRLEKLMTAATEPTAT